MDQSQTKTNLAKLSHLSSIHTFAQLCSRGTWIPYDYLLKISEIITRGVLKGNFKAIISLPPRHGKSEMMSFWFPLWYLSIFQSHRIILASYSADLATEFGRKIRNEAKSNPLIRFKVSEDSKASSRFHTSQGGALYATGVGGAATGKGANVLIIDDPYKNLVEAYSEGHRRKLEQWRDSVAKTRLEPGGSEILIMTRWHEDDLAAYLENKGGFQIIKIPAIDDEKNALNPERYSVSDLDSIKEDIGTTLFQALYMQDPKPTEGGLFKRQWWNRYGELPAFERKVQFWDCAQKPGITNDFSVCATWGVTSTGYYLLDVWRNRVEAPDLERAAESLYHKWLPDTVVIEDKSAGSSLIQYLKRSTRIPIFAYQPKGDKQVRATAATPTPEAGLCYLPRNKPFVEEFISEHEVFPNGKHDDQVDTTSMMVDFLRKPERQLRVRAI